MNGDYENEAENLIDIDAAEDVRDALDGLIEKTATDPVPISCPTCWSGSRRRRRGSRSLRSGRRGDSERRSRFSDISCTSCAVKSKEGAGGQGHRLKNLRTMQKPRGGSRTSRPSD
jgi:hypothetical protein